MAFVAMSFFSTSYSLAQTGQPKPFQAQIKAHKTELSEDKSSSASEGMSDEAPASRAEKEAAPYQSNSSAAPRRLQQHGVGLGLGQTFLLGNYSKYGDNKITGDIFYSYAASYSFDLLLNAHLSEHKDKSERMRVMGLTSSIKGRFVEYDNFSPYFLGGLGFYAPKARKVQGNDLKWTDQKVTFGLNFGSGVDLRLNDHYVVGVLGQMHWPFAVKQDEGSALRGYYFKLLITGMYLF